MARMEKSKKDGPAAKNKKGGNAQGTHRTPAAHMTNETKQAENSQSQNQQAHNKSGGAR